MILPGIIICVFKNKANILRETLLFFVGKCKVTISLAGDSHRPMGKEGVGLALEFCYHVSDLPGFSILFSCLRYYGRK